MIRSTSKLAIRCASLVAVAAVLLYGGAAAAAELSVCIDTSNPMAAIETHLAHAVAVHEHASLRVHHFDSGEGDEPYDLKDFAKLANDSCALVLGFPIDTDAVKVDLGGLHASAPYAHTGFALVTPRDSKATTLEQLPHGSKVEVTYLTTPNIYFVEHPDLIAGVALNTDDALKVLTSGQVDAAILWQPAVSRYLAEHRLENRYTAHPLRLVHANFNLVALYASQHAPAAAAFDKSIVAMQASGALRRILAPYVEAGALPASKGTAAADDPPASADSSAHSAKAALYTQAQATAGKQKFLDDCALCHGKQLEGFVGPALKGKHFAPAKADYHVSDIFAIVSKNMPASDPGSLDHQTYVEIMAFLLQENGYPAGSKALTFEEAEHSQVLFVSPGK
ncbi:MAG: transporter substrate-binding domain-containing protein [Rhodanobacteraceae bacterium]|nr:MAG: transporter substrate-binding domain-containing protein [Rhodanobacteraceae bacterium]